MNEIANKVETMLEAMPYLSKYAGKIVVIKYGGNAMINEELKANVIKDVVLLKAMGLKPVLCHGGGPGINKMLEQLDIPVKFINGLRYTSAEIIRVVEMVLIGQVNSELVGRISAQGGRAVGLSGISGNLFQCVQRSEELGYVGDVVKVNAEPVLAMLDAGFIPVVAPVGTEGLCNDIKVRDVISYLNVADVPGLKDQGTIAGGMIPKVDCCVQAIEEGVTSVHIIDGRQPHSMLYEAFSNEGTGTTVGTAQPSVGIKWNK